MNRATKTSVAVMMMILTAVSSLASVDPATPLPVLPDRAPTPVTPTVVTRKVELNQAELAKYQNLNEQSQQAAEQENAGASDTTKIVVGVICVVLVAGLVVGLANMGPGMPAGPS